MVKITFQAIDDLGRVRAEATFRKGRLHQPTTSTYQAGFRLVDVLCGADFGDSTFFTEPIIGGCTGIIERGLVWNHVV